MLDRQRFELIAASTQQIRDALQLITDTAVPGSEQQRIVIYAVDHIEWVLQEVLPTVHQEPEEVRARIKAQE
jgi:tRNA threonylcarbamoyladenosine modification (KEOPS) complex Cgi121 subunit